MCSSQIKSDLENPQGSCCKGAHYIIGVFGVLLVLTVTVLITWETIRSVLKYNEANVTDTASNM